MILFFNPLKYISTNTLKPDHPRDLKGTLSQKRIKTFVLVKFQKSMVFFQDPYLNEITCTGPFRWKTYRFQVIVILKHAKSVKDASIGIMFITKNI